MLTARPFHVNPSPRIIKARIELGGGSGNVAVIFKSLRNKNSTKENDLIFKKMKKG